MFDFLIKKIIKKSYILKYKIMEVSGDILSTYLNKETLQQNQVFLLFEKILQEYFILEYIPRKIFDSVRKTNNIFNENKNVVAFKKTSSDIQEKKEIIFLPENILLPDFFIIFEELEKKFSSQETLVSKDFKTLLSRIRSLCDLVYETSLFQEVQSDKSNCVVQQLTQSIRQKLTDVMPNNIEKQILWNILSVEKAEKWFDEVEFVWIYLERCIEEYVLRFSSILNVEDKKLLLEVVDKYVDFSLFPEAKWIYDRLSQEDKMKSKNYFKFLEKTQNWLELETFSKFVIEKKPNYSKAKVYLFVATFHICLQNNETIYSMRQSYQDPKFHSLAIERLLQMVQSLKEGVIIWAWISSYIGVLYFIIWDDKKARKYLQHSSPIKNNFIEFLNHLNN